MINPQNRPLSVQKGSSATNTPPMLLMDVLMLELHVYRALWGIQEQDGGKRRYIRT